MNAEDLNRFIIETMGLAQENGYICVVYVYTSHECDQPIEIWFDNDNDCYKHTISTDEYEDVYALTQSILEELARTDATIIRLASHIIRLASVTHEGDKN